MHDTYFYHHAKLSKNLEDNNQLKILLNKNPQCKNQEKILENKVMKKGRACKIVVDGRLNGVQRPCVQKGWREIMPTYAFRTSHLKFLIRISHYRFMRTTSLIHIQSTSDITSPLGTELSRMLHWTGCNIGLPH